MQPTNQQQQNPLHIHNKKLKKNITNANEKNKSSIYSF